MCFGFILVHQCITRGFSQISWPVEFSDVKPINIVKTLWVAYYYQLLNIVYYSLDVWCESGGMRCKPRWNTFIYQRSYVPFYMCKIQTKLRQYFIVCVLMTIPTLYLQLFSHSFSLAPSLIFFLLFLVLSRV